MSRVVHIRLPDDVVVGCYDIIEKFSNQVVANRSPASITREALEALVAWLRRSNTLPDYTKEELDARLESLGRQGCNINIPIEGQIGELMKSYEESEQDEEIGEDIFARVATQVDQLIREDGAPAIAEELVINEDPIEEESDEITIDLLQQPMIDESRLEPLQRKDIYAAEYFKTKDIKLKLAIRVAYKMLTPDLWNSGAATRLVTKLRKQAGE